MTANPTRNELIDHLLEDHEADSVVAGGTLAQIYRGHRAYHDDRTTACSHEHHSTRWFSPKTVEETAEAGRTVENPYTGEDYEVVAVDPLVLYGPLGPPEGTTLYRAIGHVWSASGDKLTIAPAGGTRGWEEVPLAPALPVWMRGAASAILEHAAEQDVRRQTVTVVLEGRDLTPRAAVEHIKRHVPTVVHDDDAGDIRRVSIEARWDGESYDTAIFRGDDGAYYLAGETVERIRWIVAGDLRDTVDPDEDPSDHALLESVERAMDEVDLDPPGRMRLTVLSYLTEVAKRDHWTTQH